MDKKTKFQNDPAKFFLFQDKLLTETEKNRAFESSNKVFDSLNCITCEKPYDLFLKAPRILIHCGHTFCTECLYLFFKDQRIRCPLCQRVVKRLRIVEVLPLNHNIHKILLKNSSVRIDPNNMKLKLPSEVIAEINEKDDTDFPLCENHEERYKHFYCKREEKIFCRACLEEDVTGCRHNIVDLYLLKPELVNYIIANISRQYANYEEEEEEDDEDDEEEEEEEDEDNE